MLSKNFIKKKLNINKKVNLYNEKGNIIIRNNNMNFLSIFLKILKLNYLNNLQFYFNDYLNLIYKIKILNQKNNKKKKIFYYLFNNKKFLKYNKINKNIINFLFDKKKYIKNKKKYNFKYKKIKKNIFLKILKKNYNFLNKKFIYNRFYSFFNEKFY
jgi:hypothetical protein